LPENKICILFAGKARAHKGLEQFVEGLKYFKNDYFLVLAGDRSQDIFKNIS
jgi:hypothetical protein